MPQPAGALNGSDLAERVLRRLTVIGAGKTPRAQDALVVTDAWDALYQEWFIDGWVDWPKELIPPYAAEGIVNVLCARLSPDFRGEPFSMSEREARVQFLQANARPESPAPVRATYF